MRVPLPKQLETLEPVVSRHRQIEENCVRIDGRRQLQELVTSLRRTDHGDPRTFNSLSQGLQEQGMIVREDNSGHRYSS